MSEILISTIIAAHLRALKSIVEYYESKSSYVDEYHGGRSQQYIDGAKRDLREFQTDIKWYKEHGDFDLLKIKKHQIANYIREYATDLREEANAFPNNIYIKWGWRRRIIEALQVLKEMYPELEIYSNHWLASRNGITLKDVNSQ